MIYIVGENYYLTTNYINNFYVLENTTVVNSACLYFVTPNQNITYIRTIREGINEYFFVDLFIEMYYKIIIFIEVKIIFQLKKLLK